MKKILVFIFCAIILNIFTGCSKTPQKYEKEYVNLFDTYTEVIFYGENETDCEKYSNIFKNSMQRLNNLFDIYNNYDGINNLKTINDNAGIKPIKVDKDIIELLKFSKEAYNISENKINCAFGSVLKIWHKYRTEANKTPENASIPSIEELKTASNYVDINSIEINEKDSTVFISNKETYIDVGALAKGYAVKKTVELLKEAGVKSALLNVGGNVCAIGSPPDKEFWNIGIQSPNNLSEIFDKVSISDQSVVTSGNYQRFYIVDNKYYHHIIDPITLMPADTYKSVTIICEDSSIADMLSTTLFILPYEDGRLLAQKYKAKVIWFFNDNRIEKNY